MSDKLRGNPYHLILGLPVETTSPNHYELLGLDQRTSDPAVSNKAAPDQNRKLLHWHNSEQRCANIRPAPPFRSSGGFGSMSFTQHGRTVELSIRDQTP